MTSRQVSARGCSLFIRFGVRTIFPCHRARQHEISYCTALERRKGQQGSEHPYRLASESEATYGPLLQLQEASICMWSLVECHSATRNQPMVISHSEN